MQKNKLFFHNDYFHIFYNPIFFLLSVHTTLLNCSPPPPASCLVYHYQACQMTSAPCVGVLCAAFSNPGHTVVLVAVVAVDLLAVLGVHGGLESCGWAAVTGAVTADSPTLSYVCAHWGTALPPGSEDKLFMSIANVKVNKINILYIYFIFKLLTTRYLICLFGHGIYFLFRLHLKLSFLSQKSCF